MTASRDPDRLIHAFLLEGEEQLQDQVYDAVRAEIEQKRQRAVFGPWRTPTMNKFVTIGLGAAAVCRRPHRVLSPAGLVAGPTSPPPGTDRTLSPPRRPYPPAAATGRISSRPRRRGTRRRQPRGGGGGCRSLLPRPRRLFTRYPG